MISDKKHIAELTAAFNRVCAENADFVAEANRDEARIVALEAENARLKAAMDKYSDHLPIAVDALESIAADSDEGFIRSVANVALKEIGEKK